MRIIVGGESRKAGKTALVCRIIAALPQHEWTAVKISGHGHGFEGPGYDLREQTLGNAAGDTLRYLEAGARRAWWLRGDLEPALPALRAILGRSENWIVESTSAIELLDHDIALLAVAGAGPAKESAARFQPLADAFVTLAEIEAPSPFLVGRLYQLGDAALIDFILGRWKGHLDEDRLTGCADLRFQPEDGGAPPESA